MGKAIKTRVRDFFKSKFDSDTSVEFLRMFLMPYAAQCTGRGTTVDQVLEMFFHLGTRDIFYAITKDSFSIPGVTRQRPYPSPTDRRIPKNKALLIVVDNVKRTAKIEVVINGIEYNFTMELYEFKAIESYLRRLPDKPGH